MRTSHVRPVETGIPWPSDVIRRNSSLEREKDTGGRNTFPTSSTELLIRPWMNVVRHRPEWLRITWAQEAAEALQIADRSENGLTRATRPAFSDAEAAFRGAFRVLRSVRRLLLEISIPSKRLPKLIVDLFRACLGRRRRTAVIANGGHNLAEERPA